MAAESFHFPFLTEDAASHQPAHRAPAPRLIDRLGRSGDAGRGRAVVAVAVGAVFFAGIGSAYMHETMTGMGSGSMSGSSASTSPAMSAPTQTSPAAQMPATVPSAMAAPAKAPMPMPSADAGPERPGGPGKPVSVASSAPVASASTPSTHTASSGSSSTGSSSSSGVSSSARSGSSTSGFSTTATSSSVSGSASASATRYSAVRSGDDFGVIAARYGVSPARIAALNPGLDSTQLTIGQSVRVP